MTLQPNAPVEPSPPLRCNPILRWAGSKRTAATTLGGLWKPEYIRYVEPFCGSAALFFSLQPREAVLSDINGDLMTFYEVISEAPTAVFTEFERIPRERTIYNEIRKTYRQVEYPVKRAAFFLYLNRNCFNGLFRTNKSGSFNVPFADKRVARYPTLDEFLRACNVLAAAQFRSGDFADVIGENVRAGDFVYLDPPYASSKRLPFKEYYPNSFDVSDLSRLSKLLEEIDRRGAFFALSYDDNKQIDSIADRWISASYAVRRNISGFASARRMANEQIITNARH